MFGSAGIADILIQNELGFQTIALGNHEFDFGTAELAALIDGSAGSETAIEESQEVVNGMTNVIPDTDAEGEFTFTLIGNNRLLVRGSFEELTSALRDTSPDGVDPEGNPIDSIHIHNAPAGQNGPIIRALTVMPDEGNLSGTFFGDFTLTDKEVAEFEAGNLYVNL